MDRDLDNGKESAVIDTEGRAGQALVVWLRGWKLIYKYRRKKYKYKYGYRYKYIHKYKYKYINKYK